MLIIISPAGDQSGPRVSSNTLPSPAPYVQYVCCLLYTIPSTRNSDRGNFLLKCKHCKEKLILHKCSTHWSPYSKLQINKVEKVQRTAARWTCRRWRYTSSVSEMLAWPSLEARRDRSSLLLFHKIHSGADKYLTLLTV